MVGPIDWGRRITPSKLGKREPAQQLGSLRAVIDALPAGGVLIVKSQFDKATQDELAAARSHELQVLSAAGGPMVLYELPPGSIVGVAPDAYQAMPSEQWADVQRVLSTRFAQVIWG